MFRNKMLAKRCKTGDGGGRKIGKGNILQRQELVEQRLSSEVSRKAQKIHWSEALWVCAVQWWGTLHRRDQSGLWVHQIGRWRMTVHWVSSWQQCLSKPVTPPWPKHNYQIDRAKSAGSLNAELVFQKNLSISHNYDETWEACQAKWIRFCSWGLENVACSLKMPLRQF